MSNNSVAWSINSRNQFSLIYPDYQGPVFSGDKRLVDISVSDANGVFILINSNGRNTLEYSGLVFPFDWQSFHVVLPVELTIRKIDASIKDKIYLILTDNSVAWIPGPNAGEGNINKEPEIIPGSGPAYEISVAPDGTVWIVASDPELGSVVKWYDRKKKKWNTLPGLTNAKKVKAGPGDNVCIINSADKIDFYDKKGAATTLPADFGGCELSIAADETIWVVSNQAKEGGARVYWTVDKGKKWHEVPEAAATLLDAGNMPETTNL